MSVKDYVSRDHVVITKDDFHKTFLHPEKILIQFDIAVRAKPYDFGSLCFTEREPIIAGWNAGKDIKSRKVVEGSLQKGRRELLKRALDYWYTGGIETHRLILKPARYNDSSTGAMTMEILILRLMRVILSRHIEHILSISSND
ncbi:hypothetical protein BOW53_08055 [Solemya pervernicosa gill symbiont]|uniref:Uncharacterized protein n=1 Tax=Solemya pervernicosa gill symbiont TaxID=642797 RepID=A0A1T2L5C3_9GAMM|nr:hypothetical protein [Solemya pervernicosa gill symbiont]OOZ40317.1 hypothetical protein BOW53_08055 [Solemya pervernicosa gill symbiont]